MAKIVGGRFNGTGAAVYICIGFVPDWVRIFVGDAADNYARHVYSKHIGAHDAVEGVVCDSDGSSYSEDTYGEGVQPYYGGDLMTTSNQTSVTYGEGVYLYPDNADYRYGPNLGPGGASGDAVSETITSWTLDTAATPTGHFNEDVNGTYIGIGSRICIDGKWYTITVLTGSQGEGDDEVELNYPAPSGEVQFIGGKYTMKPIPVGEVSKAGFKINRTTVINVNNEIQWFEAGQYDN